MKRFTLAVAGIGLALAAQARVHSDSNFIFDAALLYALALPLFLAATARYAPLLALGEPAIGVDRRSRLLWLGGALIVTALILGVVVFPRFAEIKPQPYAWALHIASVLIFIAAVFVLDRVFAPVADENASRWPAVAGWLVLGAVAVAAVLRVWKLGEVPFGVWYDEAESALQALEFLKNPDHRPLYLGSTFHTAHYNYLQAPLFHWLGPTITAMRLPSVLMGLLLVPAGYLLGSEFFWVTDDQRTIDPTTPQNARIMGVLFAALLAVSAWAVNFSRIGVLYLGAPLCIVLSLGFLLRGLRRQHLLSYAWAGLAAGMGLNLYSSFRLFVPVIPLFLLYAMITQRKLLRNSWRGLLVMTLAAFLVAGPLLSFGYHNQQEFLTRTRNTWIFANKLPEEQWPTLRQNIIKHLLMFNVHGDPNGRHNLPGRPMLDPYLGGLFVLGVGLCLWRWRRANAVLPLIWLGFTLLGGILTLDFESPQSLRSNGAMPAAYLLALIPMAEVLRAWARTPGARSFPRAAGIGAGLCFIVVGWWHFDAYFNVQLHDFASWNAFSTAETITGKTMAGLDIDTNEVYTISYFHGHPSIHFLAPQWREHYRRLETTDRMPLVWPPDKDVWIFLDADSRPTYDRLRVLYPDGEFIEHQPSFGGATTMFQVHLTRQVIDRVQGVTARYYPNAAWEGEPALVRDEVTIDSDWGTEPPLPEPFSAEWEGVLRVTSYGPHSFLLRAPAAAQLLIGEQMILSGTHEISGAVVLALGNHTLRVRAEGGAGPVQLVWRSPERGPEVLPSSYLYRAPVTANGLLGTYYPNGDWQPPAALAQIDPQINLYFHVIPLPRPYTVEWTGKIAIPVSGDYRFGLESIDDSRLFIDDQEIVAGASPNQYSEGSITLDAGLHDIRLLFGDRTAHTHVNLFWTPPGGSHQPVPSEVLFPPQGSYERVALPSLSELIVQPTSQPESLPTGDSTPGDVLPGEIVAVQSGLNRPAGIAAGPDGRIYVADTGNQRVLVLSPDGELQREVTGGAQPFQEPFDLATDPAGLVYVLDAGAGQIVVLDADGAYLRTLAVDDTYVGRSRGIAIDADGRIWLANTTRGQIVAIDADGSLLQEIPVWPGEEAQVVDAVVAQDGSILATVLGVSKLVKYDASGQRQISWDVPVANSVDSPHLAVDSAGFIYLTQPEESRVAKLAPTGERLGYWQLPTPPNMMKPIGVAADAQGRIWFVDVEGGRVAYIQP